MQTTKFLGVIFDRNLKLDVYGLPQCKKAGKKLTGLIRISKFMTFESQFDYCPLVWMFCWGQTNAMINHIHERALRAVYNDEVIPFEELLRRDKLEIIHRRNIKILTTGLFKIKNDLSKISWIK